MSVFQQILENRNLESCPLPLWRLKLTSQEYELLRSELREKAVSRAYHFSNPFFNLAKECTLFFAEYWRREYKDGAHSKQMVFDALETGSLSYELIDYFYNAAVQGARELNIEQYWGGRSDPLNDMLYQGGLPMKLVTGNETNSVWDRFTRGLVYRHIDFEELNLGVVAQQSNSLKEYCYQLIHGIETELYQFMPFYCKNENNGWFIYLKELAKQERVRRRHAHPFSLDWEFVVDFIENKISPKYIVKGMQRLPQVFLDDQGLLSKRFFPVQVRKNGVVVDTFDFVNNFCRYAVVSKHPYHHDDIISVYIDNSTEAHITDSLDMSVPHILYRNKDNKFVLGNHMGSDETLILYPQSWSVENESDYQIKDFNWELEKDVNILKGLSLSKDFVGEITLKNTDDGEIRFSKDSSMSWTDLMSSPLYLPNIDEQLYDADYCRFALSFDTPDGVKSLQTDRIQFRDKCQKTWRESPSLGEVYARAIDDTGNFVTPTKFINVGKGLTIQVLNADKETCEVKVKWPHGHVTSTEGRKKINEIWAFSKDNCPDKHHLHFTLIPFDNSSNLFTISLKAPFKEFAILDITGKEVPDGSYIPFADIDKYMYHLVVQEIREYTYGNVSKQLRWHDGELNIVNGIREQRQRIPYEGSLLTLFGSREELRYMLDWTSQNHLNAEINVSFTTDDGNRLNLIIKEFPFRPYQMGNEVIMTNIKGHPIIFNGSLKLISITNPSIHPIIIRKNEDNNGYLLPEEIKDWGMTLVYGRNRGRVSPGMVDLSRDWELKERRENYQSSIAETQNKLERSKLGDELWNRIITWFERSQKDDIPASSLTDLVAVAKSSQSLLFLAFQLFAKCANDEERENLIEQLKSFSSDLAFSWYWMRPALDRIMLQLNEFIGSTETDEFRNIYINWAIQQQEQASTLLLAINDDEQYFSCALKCITSILNTFKPWMINLCVSSLLDSYEINEESLFSEIARNILGENRKLFKIEYETYNLPKIKAQRSEDSGDVFFSGFVDGNGSVNEQKLEARINTVVAQLQGRSDIIDLFSLPESERRSVVFYCKANNERFLFGINNKLYNNQYEVREHL